MLVFAFVIVALMAGSVPAADAQEATPEATSSASLQAQIDANNQQIDALNQEIANYQAQLTQIGADKKRFSKRSAHWTSSAAKCRRR